MTATINTVVFRPDQIGELCAFYEANGYAHLHGVFDDDELATFQDELADVHERVAAAPDGSPLAPHRGSTVFPEPRVTINGKPYTHLVNAVGRLAPRTREVGVTVHLDPTGPANGFLRVVPGSHLTYHPPAGLSFESLDGEVYQLTERGDVTFLHSHCWHCATRGSADGDLGARRHFRGAWRATDEPGLEDITEEQRATYVMPYPAVR